MQDFRNAKVWEKSHLLDLGIYNVTKDFPSSDLYGLTSRLRRSALSIPSNIAERVGKGDDADLGRFLQIAFGSASGLEYRLLLAFEFKYLEANAYKELNEDLTQVKRMLSAFIQKLRADS